MNCDRSKPQTYWTNFGKRAASFGISLQDAIKPIDPAKIQMIEWITTGHNERIRKMQRQAALSKEPRT